jgi:excisionase family DNA binding protein
MQRESRDALLKKQQVAKRGQLSLRKVDYEMANGKLPFVKIGGAVRFLREDVDRWIRSQRVAGVKNKIRKTSASP